MEAIAPNVRPCSLTTFAAADAAHLLTLPAFAPYELYEQDVRPRLKESAWNIKAHIIETEIIPYLGDLKISEVTAADVLRWQNDIQSLTDSGGQPYSSTYLRTI